MHSYICLTHLLILYNKSDYIALILQYFCDIINDEILYLWLLFLWAKDIYIKKQKGRLLVGNNMTQAELCKSLDMDFVIMIKLCLV